MLILSSVFIVFKNLTSKLWFNIHCFFLPCQNKDLLLLSLVIVPDRNYSNDIHFQWVIACRGNTISFRFFINENPKNLGQKFIFQVVLYM